MVITVETSVHDTKMTPIETFVNQIVDLAMKSANMSSGRSVDSNVLENDERDCSDKVQGIQMNTSTRINSYIEFNRIQ